MQFWWSYSENSFWAREGVFWESCNVLKNLFWRHCIVFDTRRLSSWFLDEMIESKVFWCVWMYDLSAGQSLALRASCTLQWKVSFLVAYIWIQKRTRSGWTEEVSWAVTFLMQLCSGISEMSFAMSDCHSFKFWSFCLTPHGQLWCQMLISQWSVCCR